MVIKKCEHKSCTKAGTCKCPKDRSLKSYWHLCKDHAAEYNKSWNYYAGMTMDEINKEWEKDVFGTRDGTSNYQQFVFSNEKTSIKKKTIPANVAKALAVFDLTIKDNWEKIQKKYRVLAKSAHPDTGESKDSSKFIKISVAYQTLKKYFNK